MKCLSVNNNELTKSATTVPRSSTRANGHQGFGSECKEYIGIDIKHQFYYGLEIGEGDLSWHGPFETREKAEEELEAAYDRWDKRVGEREEAWEAEQIARCENPERAEELKEQMILCQNGTDFGVSYFATKTRCTYNPVR
jgi:hypothetical protein